MKCCRTVLRTSSVKEAPDNQGNIILKKERRGG